MNKCRKCKGSGGKVKISDQHEQVMHICSYCGGTGKNLKWSEEQLKYIDAITDQINRDTRGELILDTRLRRWMKMYNISLSEEQYNELICDIAEYATDCLYDSELQRDNKLTLIERKWHDDI